ncbi:MAG: hypothetical protein IAE80_12800 [Anaerolinea sp.]|nr:hypothetical protein [Anaerolinea sp.]
MIIELLASHIGIPAEDVQGLLELNTEELLQNEYFQSLVGSIDGEILSTTIGPVRAIYDQQLPALINYLRSDHGLAGKPMTSSTLGNWVIAFLHHPDELSRLLEFHQRVPTGIIEAGLPHLLEMLDGIGAAAPEWKKALALLSVPLMTSN